MNLIDKFSLNASGEVISIVGAGGKTTLMFSLSQELKKQEKSVLITTTTAIYNPEVGYDHYFLEDIDEDYIPKPGSITVLGNKIENGKLKGVSPELIDRINEKNIFDFILIEADGSKRKPIKAPRSGEPLVAISTTRTIGVIGMDSLGLRINNENVHRIEYFIKITGKKEEEKIESTDLVKLVLSPYGLFKDSLGEKILFLNKCKESDIEDIKKIRQDLIEKNFKNIIAGDIIRGVFY